MAGLMVGRTAVLPMADSEADRFAALPMADLAAAQVSDSPMEDYLEPDGGVLPVHARSRARPAR